ncbi:MAG: hypothetical protein GWN00_19955 [Aliifodinibius sp.]|nr:hypothetical protein [Fodinibius sp.]NIY26996.1 hypothetical protein [Fodinibius sp.]
MADNTELNAGTGGDTIATDDIGGVKHQRVKVQYGADGSATDVSTSNPMPAIQKNSISSGNSSTTPLGISGVFTGSWVDMTDYAAVSIIINTDQDSATNGLQLQWSTDSSNIDHTQTHSVTGGESFTIQGMHEAQYFRVVYTNGAVAQTHFRLQTILKQTPSVGEVEQLDEPINDDADAQLVRSVIAGRKPDTSYVNIGATTGGNLKMSLQEASEGMDIGAGNAGTETLRVSISTDDVNLSAINTNIATVAGAVSGTEIQADVLSVIPGTGATNLGKAEDSAHSSGDTGVMMLGVRNDTLASLGDTDGDYVPLQFDSSGSLYVKDGPNIVDSGNSTTTPLSGGATFTGTGIDVLDYTSVSVILHSSHDGATDGMLFEWSTDNTNWDTTKTFSYSANTGRTFQFGVQAQYFRVRFTNGGTAQTHLRIQTILHKNTTSTTIHRLVDDESPDRSAELVKAAIVAQVSGSGDFTPVASNANGKLQVAADTGLDTDVSTIAGAVSGTEMQVDVVAALPAGTNNIGDVDVATIAAGSNLIGDVGLSGARTSGGTTLYKNIDVDESEDQIKGTAGQVYWIHAINLGTAPRFLKFYNATAASVTVGTTTPDLTFPVPSQGTTDDGAGFTLSIPNGIAFGTAITIAATTGVADADAGAPGANEVIVNLGYA